MCNRCHRVRVRLDSRFASADVHIRQHICVSTTILFYIYAKRYADDDAAATCICGIIQGRHHPAGLNKQLFPYRILYHIVYICKVGYGPCMEYGVTICMQNAP